MGFFRKKSDDDAIKDAESSLIEKPVEIPEPGPTPEQIQIDSQSCADRCTRYRAWAKT